MARLTLLLVLIAAGCNSPASAPTPPPPAPAPAPPEPEPKSDPADDPDPNAIPKDAEPLPEPPKLAPDTTHKPLTPDKTLLLEVAPDPDKPGQVRPVRVLVNTEVCLRRGPLELLVCREQTKEHEAILRTVVDARLIHAALIAIKLTPGKPVQFVNPETQEEDYQPATGPKVAVSVHYRREGKLHTHPAQEWVREVQTQKPMHQHWVFAGSQLYPFPDEPDRPPHYAANGGDVVSLSNFPSAMLDLPVKSSQDNADLVFEAFTERIPPVRSRAWLIFAPTSQE